MQGSVAEALTLQVAGAGAWVPELRRAVASAVSAAIIGVRSCGLQAGLGVMPHHFS